jgi:hypothetical protein
MIEKEQAEQDEQVLRAIQYLGDKGVLDEQERDPQPGPDIAPALDSGTTPKDDVQVSSDTVVESANVEKPDEAMAIYDAKPGAEVEAGGASDDATAVAPATMDVQAPAHS